MAEARYRKLPGHRRGLIRGSSMWMGADHLLWVKSMRIREEYRRFHFRDVQAITVARAPRFHISTRSLFLGALWAVLFVIVRAAAPQFDWMAWVLGGALVVAWVVISAWFSCRCRLYTAVSREELPSVYRAWTAKRFLAKVTPAIQGVQGAVDANWAEAAEARQASAASEPVFTPAGAASPVSSKAKTYTLAASLFIATLFASGSVDLYTLKSTWSGIAQVQIFFIMALLVEAVILFVEHYRGVLRAAMRNLAICELVAIGVMYYVRQMISSLNAGLEQGKAGTALDLKVPLFYSGGPWVRGINAAICIILGLAGLIVAYGQKEPPAPPEMKP